MLLGMIRSDNTVQQEQRSTTAGWFGLFIEAFQLVADCSKGIWQLWQSVPKMAGWQREGCTRL